MPTLGSRSTQWGAGTEFPFFWSLFVSGSLQSSWCNPPVPTNCFGEHIQGSFISQPDFLLNPQNAVPGLGSQRSPQPAGWIRTPGVQGQSSRLWPRLFSPRSPSRGWKIRGHGCGMQGRARLRDEGNKIPQDAAPTAGGSRSETPPKYIPPLSPSLPTPGAFRDFWEHPVPSRFSIP